MRGGKGDKIIVLFPTWLESKPFMELYGTEVETAKCGVGSAECAARTAHIICEKRPTMLILAGIAGAYGKSGLKKCDTVLVERENNADLGTIREDGFNPLPKIDDNTETDYYICDTQMPDIFPKVTSNTVNVAATTNKNRRFIDADIENMEGAAFFAVCTEFRAKFMELRTISNYVGEQPAEWLIPGAVETLAKNVKRLVDHIKERA